MKEILGNNLSVFFTNAGIEAKRTYKGERYEVWELSDTDYEKICTMSEKDFEKLADSENSWWRGSDGSNLTSLLVGEVKVNNQIMQGWIMKPWNDYTIYEDEGAGDIKYQSLSDYLCNVIGASQPRNVVACAMDLAKHNKMTMGELFTKYEPTTIKLNSYY